MPTALEVLQQRFGYPAFRLNQADIIESLIQGQDVLALMPTGGGKSLCYQIPALVRDGTAIVVSPLIALMQDQVSALNQLGINAAFINSTLSYQEYQATEQALINGQLDILYVAPERLLMPKMLGLLERIQVALFAIDEAHCVSQWGHDFRKEYQQLFILHERFPNVPRIALTATADQRTRQEIIQQLNLSSAAIYINSFDRPNIRYAISEGQNARQSLWLFLEQNHPDDSGIVYCLSRKKVEETAQWLSEKGRLALPYHAKLPHQVRQHNQARFLREENIIIVATIAFGMGIDKPDVRFVAHLNLPKSIEAYYQETGRAGRDGQPANVFMFYGLQDVITLRNMMMDSDANETFKRISQNKLDAMLGLCESIQCRRNIILQYFDEDSPKKCGNCDNCITPPETWDASQAVQKALSCVYRTEQRFGVNYLIDVLLGKDIERIKRFGHDRISTYGIGQELTAVEWRSLYRQLIAMGLLSVNVEAYGAIQLTESCRPYLRGEQTLQARKSQKPSRSSKPTKAKNTNLRQCDEDIFAALRQLRLALAKEQGLPPYVIFHDSTLIELSRRRPQKPSEMTVINGIGEQKLAKYGADFLACIAQFPIDKSLDNTLSDTINDTLFYYQQGIGVEEISLKRDVKLGTIFNHLAQAIEADVIALDNIREISPEQRDQVIQTIELLDSCKEKRLKPVFSALDETISHEIIRCVMAHVCR